MGGSMAVQFDRSAGKKIYSSRCLLTALVCLAVRGLGFWVTAGVIWPQTAAATPQTSQAQSNSTSPNSITPPDSINRSTVPAAKPVSPKPKPTLTEQAAEVGIEPALLENSPVLRRWLQSPPDLMQDIQQTPVFSPQLRTGITSRNNDLGAELSLEDIFVGQTPLTLSGTYQTEFAGREQSFAVQMRYYTLPLGSYFNIAPTLGYRQINLSQQPQISGVDLGLQGVFVLSPHAADLRLGQTFTAPGASTETGITTISASYAITPSIRLHSRVEWRRNPGFYDQRFYGSIW